jgi:TPR repeat protein
MNEEQEQLGIGPNEEDDENLRMYEESRAAWERGDLQRAKKLLLVLAEKEIAVAQHALGNLLLLEDPEQPNHAEAKKWLSRAAKQNYEPSFYSIGRIYANGEGVERSDAQALDWFVEGAKVGSVACAEMAGELLASGRLGEARIDLAIPLYEQAANGGSALAQRRLAYYYQNGQGGLRQDSEKALQLYEASAIGKDGLAAYNLGGMIEDAAQSKADIVRAIRWYAVAVELGIEIGIQNLGVCFSKIEDYATAAAWFEVGTECGLKLSMVSMSYIFDRGEGVPIDKAMAQEWKNRATQTENEIINGIVLRTNDADRMTAEAGRLASVNLLGEMYFSGAVLDRDLEKAMALLTQAANMGIASAQAKLAVMYVEGMGTGQDYTKALALFKQAAAQGSADSMRDLGRMYKEGLGVPQDYEAALSWFRMAAEKDQPLAQYDLGNMYRYGLGAPQDYGAAMTWFMKAAEHGHIEAQTSVGVMFEAGWGVPQDFKKAASWYEKAADQGSPEAQSFLGAMYANGQGMEQDDATAVAWFQAATEQGFGYAAMNLGVMYEQGRGVVQDYTTAASCYRLGAEQGHAFAQLKLGLMLVDGVGVSKDRSEAASWFQKAADQGEPAAQHQLGVLYEWGDGVSQDYAVAVSWYQKSAEQGVPAAQYCLGRAYLLAQGVAHDPSAAFHWTSQAADRGEALAQSALAWMYVNGQGTSASYERAAFWHHKAANQGFARSQYELGLMHYTGSGVPKDVVHAYFWICLAAAAVSSGRDTLLTESISAARERIADEMSDTQIAEAVKLTAEWKPKSVAQSMNEQAFAAAKAWQQADLALAAHQAAQMGPGLVDHSSQQGLVTISNSAKALSLLEQATSALQSGASIGDAIKLFEEVLRCDPAVALNDEAASLRAEAYLKAGLSEPKRALDLYNIALIFGSLGMWREAGMCYQASADLDPLFAWHFNNFSWMAATSEDVRAHSGRYAVILATRACEVSGWGYWSFIGTLAAAFARAGDFQRAADWQKIALKLAPEDQKASSLEMLQRFESGEAYIDREHAPAAGEAAPSKAELEQIDVDKLIQLARELIGDQGSKIQ